jgi:hypothetical protein
MHALRHSGFAALRRGGLVLAALALFGLSGCVAYPAGPYGYSDGGYYAPAPAYVYAPPPVVGGVYLGGWGGGWGGGGGWHGHPWR